MPMVTKGKLQEIAANLDPLQLLEEMRAVQAYLSAMADGEIPPPMTSEPPNLAAFVASLSSAWHQGEIRPTFSTEAKPRYLRALQKISEPARIIAPALAAVPATAPAVDAPSIKPQEKPQPSYAPPGHARVQALRMVWPIACRRLEGFPNINATQLFDELCIQFPGRFTRRQYKSFLRRVNLWRQEARARGVVIGPKTIRRLSDKPRGRRRLLFADHWGEMVQCLDERPDQTAMELLMEFQARYPGSFSLRQLYTLQKRVRAWRQQAVQRLIRNVASNILGEATGSKVT
jgi:hypothetical protein